MNLKTCLNALEIILVLLNVGTKAFQFNLESIIRQRADPGNLVTCVAYFLETSHANRRRHQTNRFLDSFYRSLDNMSRLYPNNLAEFDISACNSIARCLLNIQNNIYIDLIRVRNVYLGHSRLLEIEDQERLSVLNDLKEIIDSLSSNDVQFQLDLRNEIKSIVLRIKFVRLLVALIELVYRFFNLIQKIMAKTHFGPIGPIQKVFQLFGPIQ